MPANAAGRTGDICDCLRLYLHAHPEAADSLSGIRQWWLPEALREVEFEELREALAQLVASGEIQRSTLPDMSQLYARGAPPGARKSTGQDD
jgi:hypothetical protein